MKWLAFIFIIALSACQKSQSPWVKCSESSGDMHVHFVIEHDGTMTYRGGIDVIAQRDTWTYQLSRDNLQDIQKLISTLKLDQVESAKNVFVDGKQMYGDEQCEELLRMLRNITSRRFDEVIDGLPKPSADVLIQRSIEGERHEQEAQRSTF